jgi:hypothetical protein
MTTAWKGEGQVLNNEAVRAGADAKMAAQAFVDEIRKLRGDATNRADDLSSAWGLIWLSPLVFWTGVSLLVWRMFR